MKITEARELFPIVNKILYFDAASLTPYCTPVLDAQERFARERRDLGSLQYDEWYERIDNSRKLAAILINASPREIAFVKNTTEGVNLTASIIDWEKGDEVLVCDCDFPTNIFPFLNLKNRGVTVKYVRCKNGRAYLEEIEEEFSDKTRLLSISHVFYNSGYRIDLEELGKLCKERRILLHVDAAQSLGAFKINAEKAGIDFLSACGFKWLLSPLGTGVYFMKKRYIELEPPILGWLSVKDHEKLNTKRLEILKSSKRFEAGTLNIGGFLGMAAAMELINSIGIRTIEKRVLELSQTLAEALDRTGRRVISDIDKKHRSGIICVEKGNITKDHLRERGIVATVRKNLRLSPHIYNDEEEIEKLANAISKL
jgi:selenocysteine lyase/cysteine desulfurase